MDCLDCKWFHEYSIENKCVCAKLNKVVSDIEVVSNNCNEFEKLRSCDTCENARYKVYETGTIDGVEYRCTLQNEKIMVEDTSVFSIHNDDFPSCPINSYKEDCDT